MTPYLPGRGATVPYVSMTTSEPNGQWSVRPYLDEDRRYACHLTLHTATSNAHVSMIVDPHEAADLMEACRAAIEGMRDLDSHPALTERD